MNKPCIAWVILGFSLLSAPRNFLAAQSSPAERQLLAADYEKKRIAIVDAHGAIRWEHPITDLHDLHRLTNGNILFQTSFTKLVELTPDKRVVWSYDAAAMNGNQGKPVEVHAFQRLNNGLTMIAESGPGRIIEVNSDGKIQHEIKLKLESPHPHSDTRLVRKLENGHYLVAHERDGAVREYDVLGKVVWDYPVPKFGKDGKPGHGPEAFGNSVFCALRLANGNTLIATGNGHSVLEVTPDKRIVWSLHQNELPGITLAWVTTLEVLPNGNIIVGNCHAGPGHPQIIEVTRDKKVVWTFKDFENFGNALSNSQILGIEGKVVR